MLGSALNDAIPILASAAMIGCLCPTCVSAATDIDYTHAAHLLYQPHMTDFYPHIAAFVALTSAKNLFDK